MDIKLKINYRDLLCFMAFTKHIEELYFSQKAVCPSHHLERRIGYNANLFLAEKLNHKFNLKQHNWPALGRHKVLRTISVNPIEAYFLWSNYPLDRFPLIQDKIQIMSKILSTL